MGNPDFGSKCWGLISILFSIPFTLFNFMFWLLCLVGQRNLFVPPTVELVKTEKSAEKTIVLIILWCLGCILFVLADLGIHGEIIITEFYFPF